MMVLIVEDHADTRDMYAGYLARRGILVETAVTGLQAITKASLFAPDAVVMDLGLPGLDGWEATRRLRSSLHTSDVPVIALSAHVDETSEARAMEAGARLFLAKPCSPGALWEALHMVCRSRARAVAALSRPAPPVGIPSRRRRRTQVRPRGR
jgi:DNA-binding response OmpR family regulator